MPVDGLGGGVVRTVQQGEGHVGIFLSRLQDGVGVLVAGGVDHVVAEGAVGDDGIIVGVLRDGVGDLGLASPCFSAAAIMAL